MTARPKRTAYLIATWRKREAPRVYAVIAFSRDEALAQVRALAMGDTRLKIVGGLSRDLARRLDLQVGETRLI